MSDTELMAAFFRNVMALAEGRGKIDLKVIKVVGNIREGRDTVHVISRLKLTAGKFTFEYMDFVTLKMEEKEWRLQIPENMKPVLRKMRALFSK